MSADVTAPLPVHVLTGFLGSGKTTLLNELLRTPELADAAVLINEYGDVAIDHLLVREAREELIVLESGCVCCTLRTDLLTQLGELLDQRERGTIPRFSRIVLETTGLADPGPIVQTLIKQPALADRLFVEGVICTVDTQLGRRTLAHHPEAQKQVSLADRLLLTKLDLSDDAEVALLERELEALNPEAPRVRVERSRARAELLTGTRHLDTRSIVGGVMRARSVPHHHTHDVRSFSVVLEREVDFRSFSLWVAMITQFWGERLLRLKAVVSARGEAHPIAVQAVQHIVYPPLDLPASLALQGKSYVVLLARGLSDQEGEEIAVSLRALASE